MDLGGEWRLDRALRDGDAGDRGRGFEARRRGGSWERGGRGGRGPRFPATIRIEQTPGGVTIADSSGAPLQRITTGTSGEDASSGSVPAFSGEWKNGTLEVVREGRRGRVRETFSLQNQGRTLVIQTNTESNGPRPSREFKRVYRRMST